MSKTCLHLSARGHHLEAIFNSCGYCDMTDVVGNSRIRYVHITYDECRMNPIADPCPKYEISLKVEGQIENVMRILIRAKNMFMFYVFENNRGPDEAYGK